MSKYIQQLLTLATQNPRALFAVVAGILLAWAIAQRVKFWLPITWSCKAREITVQATAFASGFLATFLIWKGATDKLVDPIVASLIVGLLAPALWNIAMFGLSLWKPAIAKALSQSSRAVAVEPAT